MKTISDKRKKQSGFNHYHWGILRTSLLLTFLVGTLLIMAVKVAASDEESGWAWRQLAQETNGYWQLVDTIIDPVPDERVTVERMGVPDEGKAYAEEIRSGVLCAIVTNSLSEGSFTKHKEWYQDKKCYTSSANYTFVATWGQPPGRITPGTPLSLEANVSKTLNVQPGFGGSIQMGITTDAPHTTCGYLTAGAKDVARFVVSTDDRSDKNPEAILLVGAGSSAGEQFALRYCVSGNFGYRYIYQWVVADEKPAEPSPTLEPTATEEPEVLVNVGGDILVLNPAAFLSWQPGDFEAYLPLADVKVYLLHGGEEIDQTYSSLDGLFGFWDITETEDLVIKVELAHGIHPPGGTPYFQVVYDQQTDPISFSTQPFEIDPEESELEIITIQVDYAHELDYRPTQLEAHQLIDAALTYYYLRSSWHFAALHLGQPLDLPGITKIFSSDTRADAFWYGDFMLKDGPWSNPEGTFISLDATHSNYRLYDRGGVVMHEFGHHIMADTFDNHMPRVLNDRPHGGFSNSSTADSWAEGFATFYAAWVQRDLLGKAAPHLIELSKNDKWVVNLEENKLAWSRGTGEEFAAAALLWDLIDPIDKNDCTVFPVFNYTIQPYITPDPVQAFTAYCDYVQLTNDQLWEILTSNYMRSDSPNSPENYDYIFDMMDLYRNLKFSYGYYAVENDMPDVTHNQLDPIDELFIAHGFFADVNPQNLAYDLDEAIGMTSNEALEFGYRIGNQLIIEKSFPARPERRSPPPPPESYIGYQLYDTRSGSYLTPEVGDFFLVEVFYDPPFELYNYSFETRAGSAGKLLYYGPAEHYAATIRVYAVGLEREPVNVLEFSNEFYWREGYDRGEEPFIEHVFEVQGQQRADDDDWVLLAVLTSTGTLCCAGLMIILAVVVVILLRRRKESGR